MLPSRHLPEECGDGWEARAHLTQLGGEGANLRTGLRSGIPTAGSFRTPVRALCKIRPFELHPHKTVTKHTTFHKGQSAVLAQEKDKIEALTRQGKNPQSDLRTSIAQTDSDFDDVFRLNHEIFAEELQQHPLRNDRRLIDAHHERNTYFLVRSGEALLGMICATHYDGKRFSVEGKLRDPSLIDHLRGNAIEMRLLAVRPKARGTSVVVMLLRALAEYALDRGFRIGLISGVEKQARLYRKMGFEDLGASVQSGQAKFIPMKIEFERYLAFVRAHPAFLLPGDERDSLHE